jgi:hypothetical protein
VFTVAGARQPLSFIVPDLKLCETSHHDVAPLKNIPAQLNESSTDMHNYEEDEKYCTLRWLLFMG